MFNERSGIQGGESNTGPPEYEAGGLKSRLDNKSQIIFFIKLITNRGINKLLLVFC